MSIGLRPGSFSGYLRLPERLKQDVLNHGGHVGAGEPLRALAQILVVLQRQATGRVS